MSFPWPSVIRSTTEGVGAVPLTMDVGIPGCGVCPYRYNIVFVFRSSFIQLHEFDLIVLFEFALKRIKYLHRLVVE